MAEPLAQGGEDVLPLSTPPVPVAGRAPWERRWQKRPARGRGPKPQSSGGVGNYPSKVALLPSVVNSWQTGSVLSPGYVRRSEDRLSEPQFQPSPALPGLRAYAQDYLGAGIVPTPQPR